MGDWKAIRPRGPKAPWELYNLATDLGETVNLAQKHPDVLARMIRLAEAAHTPIQPGEVYDQALVTKDRHVPLGKPLPAEK